MPYGCQSKRKRALQENKIAFFLSERQKVRIFAAQKESNDETMTNKRNSFANFYYYFYFSK